MLLRCFYTCVCVLNSYFRSWNKRMCMYFSNWNGNRFTFLKRQPQQKQILKGWGGGGEAPPNIEENIERKNLPPHPSLHSLILYFHSSLSTTILSLTILFSFISFKNPSLFFSLSSLLKKPNLPTSQKFGVPIVVFCWLEVDHKSPLLGANVSLFLH